MRSRPSPSLALPARASLALVVVALLVVSAAPVAHARITREFSADQDLTLSPGIEYVKGRMWTTGGRIQAVRVTTVDPSHPSVALRSMLSNDMVLRKERPTRIAKRKSRPGMVAMSATNGDRSVFGRTDAYAAPNSMHVSGGEVMVVQACARPTLGIDASGDARIDDVRIHLAALPPGKDMPRQIHRVNTHRDDTKVVLFTRRFGPSTRTRRGGVEVVLDLPHVLRPNDVQTLRVRKVRRGGGDTRLRAGQAVLSVRGRGKARWVYQLRRGQRLRVETAVVRSGATPCGGMPVEAQGWGDIVEAMGGNYFTARNGRVAAPGAGVYRPSVERHPRTNVGVTGDGRVLMVTVDGRQPGYSVGVTLAEMGQLMLSLGARAAFNLDGGGSTVMGRRNLSTGAFQIANRPSDGRERVHSQALVAFEVD